MLRARDPEGTAFRQAISTSWLRRLWWSPMCPFWLISPSLLLITGCIMFLVAEISYFACQLRMQKSSIASTRLPESLLRRTVCEWANWKSNNALSERKMKCVFSLQITKLGKEKKTLHIRRHVRLQRCISTELRASSQRIGSSAAVMGRKVGAGKQEDLLGRQASRADSYICIYYTCFFKYYIHIQTVNFKKKSSFMYKCIYGHMSV